MKWSDLVEILSAQLEAFKIVIGIVVSLNVGLFILKVMSRFFASKPKPRPALSEAELAAEQAERRYWANYWEKQEKSQKSKQATKAFHMATRKARQRRIK